MTTRRVICALVVVLAFGLGFLVAYSRILPRDIQKVMRDSGDNQQMATIISLAALEKLEKNDVDGAKRVLARQVAAYYQTYHKLARPSEMQQKIRGFIERTSETSPVLKQMMSEPSP